MVYKGLYLGRVLRWAHGSSLLRSEGRPNPTENISSFLNQGTRLVVGPDDFKPHKGASFFGDSPNRSSIWFPFQPYKESTKRGRPSKKDTHFSPLSQVEKAHPDVFNVLLQLLDDGRQRIHASVGSPARFCFYTGLLLKPSLKSHALVYPGCCAKS